MFFSSRGARGVDVILKKAFQKSLPGSGNRNHEKTNKNMDFRGKSMDSVLFWTEVGSEMSPIQISCD